MAVAVEVAEGKEPVKRSVAGSIGSGLMLPAADEEVREVERCGGKPPISAAAAMRVGTADSALAAPAAEAEEDAAAEAAAAEEGDRSIGTVKGIGRG